jgi:uracil-DNA glycosylase family protein
MATAPERPGAERYAPDTLDLTVLRDAAGGCEGCELYRDATQTIFGSGPPDASMMLIGEQPGDMEDRNGVPFIGPAGRLLRNAMEASGIDVERVYLTNAVKHFRWKATAQGNRRIHQKPAAGNITACRPWLQAELRSVQPAVVVASEPPRHRPFWDRSSR